eukprot:TRINITY_DN2306_c0_g1_i1.p1 TRINITY_DN2306_c0_g1~~TRINITY_DN2306_c0_g1_i1.p1  ORF type:complete len:421 (+),score=169.19 TRINITY_DN2306_c0_g1_i1:248-1510(+)
MSDSPVFELLGSVQNYEWGKVGSASIVAQVAQQPVDEGKPYAELWMGTHANGPSLVRATGQPLRAWIEAHPAALGDALRTRWPELSGESQLPFLFKILSVAKALSIQAHPDKALAASLAVRRGDLYKDSNHKPEMALAVSAVFEALCQFRPRHDICRSLQLSPELRRVVGESAACQFEGVAADADESTQKAALRALFTALMTAPEDRVRSELQALVSRLSASTSIDQREQLALRIHQQFPGDVGVLSVYLLNYVRLGRGEAIFLAANEPHAYLAGECAELMAASDNVVRAGLTPKYKDVETLTSMLTYRTGAPTVLRGDSSDGVRHTYPAPIDDFLLETLTLPADSTYDVGGRPAASILLCFEGCGQVCWQQQQQQHTLRLQRGTVVFVSAHTPLTLRSSPGTDGSPQPLLVFSSTANVC